MNTSSGILVIRVGVFPSSSETFITLQAKQAIDLGYDVRILVDKKKGLADSSQAELIKQYNLLDRTFQLSHIYPSSKWHRLKAMVQIIGHGVPWKVMATLNYFKYGLEGFKGKYLFQYESVRDFIHADIIHIQFGVYKFPFDELSALGVVKGKLITTFHGFDAHFNEEDRAEKSAYYKLLFQYGHLFTANSDYLKNKLIALACPIEKLQVVPMPVDTGFFRSVPKKDNEKDIRLLSVGRLIELKGHEYGIRAVKELRLQGFTVRYKIIGSGDELKRLKKIISDLELEQVVELAGDCNQEEVLHSMQSSDIFLMTSTCDKAGRREAQGVVVAEAQACGLPVVAFRSGGVPSAIAEGISGLLATENDVEGMAEHLEHLIRHPELRKSMGIAARTYVEENFSLDLINERWARLYSKSDVLLHLKNNMGSNE